VASQELQSKPARHAACNCPGPRLYMTSGEPLLDSQTHA
jgi:hypothetical protein